MLGVVVGRKILEMYVLWEVVGVCWYVVIGL